MKRLDRGHLHLKLEGPRTDMFRPGILLKKIIKIKKGCFCNNY